MIFIILKVTKLFNKLYFCSAALTQHLSSARHGRSHARKVAYPAVLKDAQRLGSDQPAFEKQTRDSTDAL